MLQKILLREHTSNLNTISLLPTNANEVKYKLAKARFTNKHTTMSQRGAIGIIFADILYKCNMIGSRYVTVHAAMIEIAEVSWLCITYYVFLCRCM